MSQREGSAWAAGWIAFAGFMMIMLGAFHAVAGLVGIIDDQFYVSTQKYVFQFDRTTWGWINLIIGIIVVLAGFGVFSGALWARIVGVILGGRQRDRGVRMVALLPDLGDRDHRGRDRCDLGAHRCTAGRSQKLQE